MTEIKSKDEEHSEPEYAESDASEMDKESEENESGLPGQPPAKKSRKSKNVPLPTVEEMNEYKEIENLHHSSLFRMQINELLHEMKLSLIKALRFEKCIEQLKKTLLNLPQGDKYNLADQNWVEHLCMCVPLIQNPQKVRGMFCFYPPQSVCIIGSFLQGTAIKNKSRIDVAVEMPQKFYQMKDFMNHRYIRKRALYLITIAKHLKEQPFVEKEMNFTYHNGDHFKPILVISLTDSKGKCCKVHIHAVPATFQLSRFNFSKNNVRNAWFYGNDTADDKDADEQQLSPTALHNMSVMSDIVMLNNFKSVEAAFGFDNSQLKDGILLLKIWLHQRQLSEGYGAFSTYIMSMFVIFLLRTKKLNKLMSSYQVFRTTLYNLANSNWIEKGITLSPPENMQDPSIPKLEEFKGPFDVVFVDFTGYLNLTANMNRFTYLEVKQEAAITVKSLDSQQSGTFETIFMKNVPFHMRYDQIFHISDLSQFENEAKKPEFSQRYLDLGGHYIHTVTPSVISFLQKILNKRIGHIQMKPIMCSEWSVNESPPWVSDISTLTFGITIVEEHAYNVIEKGPVANLPEAKEFRAFWGDKSEMRKFSDGSICETVLWTEGTTIAHKRNICSQIISYMLNKAYNISTQNISITENLFNSVLTEHSKKENSGTGEEEILKIISAYDNMCKILRKCDLPIEIKDIQSISPILRFAEVFPPQPARYSTSYKKLDKRLLPDPTKPCPSVCPYFTVLCLMGSSKRNIEELDSLERLKAMCHLQLQQNLRKDFYLPMSCNQKYLDVLLYGYVFRIKMCFSKELDILRLTIHSEASQALWGELRLLPKLTSFLHSLGLEHGSYSTVVRLAKRWISSHMLCSYVPEVAVELIVANLFLSPEPFQTPKSPVTGFNRFLQFLSTFDWETSPLLVDLNKEFTATDVIEITRKFNSSRECLPAMCICTPVDTESPSFWTRENPNRMMINRLRTIAQQSLSILNENLSQPNPKNDFKMIFRTSLEPFDVVLYLNSNQLGRHGQGVDSKLNLHKDQRELLTNNLPVVDYEPNQLFLRDLTDAFNDLALFFHDPYDSDVIGMVWKPNIFNNKPFKVSECNMHMVINSDKSSKPVETVPNVEAIIEDIKIMGKGILCDIKLKTRSFLK